MDVLKINMQCGGEYTCACKTCDEIDKLISMRAGDGFINIDIERRSSSPFRPLPISVTPITADYEQPIENTIDSFYDETYAAVE